MPKALRILPLFLLVALGGCRPAPEREGEVVLADGSLPVSFEVVGEGAMARVPAPFEAAVRDEQAWDTLRADLPFRRPVERVDFAGAMLLAAVADVPSSGHALRFESVEEEDGEVVATYTVYTPAADCFTDFTPQRPFQVVRLRRIEGPVRFVRNEQALPCTMERW